MRNLILLISIVLSLGACSDNNNDCSDLFIDTTSLENEYGCADTRHDLKIDLVDDYIVIKNQADFERLVTGACLPNIDFEPYDLVIGETTLPKENESIDYKLTQNCKNKNLTLIVTFNYYLSQEVYPNNITYHALIPKIKGEQKLNVEIVKN